MTNRTPWSGGVERVYPLVAYNNRSGEYDITLPINLRFDLGDSGYGLSDVEDVVRDHRGWTDVVATVGSIWPTKEASSPDVWSEKRCRFRPPAANYRELIDPLGPLVGYHLYLWSIRSDSEVVGVAAQTHADIGTPLDHVGRDFDRAAEVVSSAYAAAGWRVVDDDFDYGVGPGHLDFWGPTGDRMLSPPRP